MTWVATAAIEALSFGSGAGMGLVARRWRPYRTVGNLRVPAFLLGMAVAVGCISAALVWRIGPPSELADPPAHAVELLGAFISSVAGFWLVSKFSVMSIIKYSQVGDKRP